MQNSSSIHGVFLEIYNYGVLLTGPSNIGKSETALSLIKRGHRLIADDLVSLHQENDLVIGSCPAPSQGFLAIRDIGIINVTKIFGPASICGSKKLDLIIKLTPNDQHNTPINTCLKGSVTMQTLLNIAIPVQLISVSQNRHLADLIEISVQVEHLKCNGYNAYNDFRAKHSLNFQPS